MKETITNTIIETLCERINYLTFEVDGLSKTVVSQREEIEKLRKVLDEIKIGG